MTEIHRLKQECAKLINKDLFGKEDVVKYLTWAKDCVGKLKA